MCPWTRSKTITVATCFAKWWRLKSAETGHGAPQRRAYVAASKIIRRKVSFSPYLAFVDLLTSRGQDSPETIVFQELYSSSLFILRVFLNMIMYTTFGLPPSHNVMHISIIVYHFHTGGCVCTKSLYFLFIVLHMNYEGNSCGKAFRIESCHFFKVWNNRCRWQGKQNPWPSCPITKDYRDEPI